MRARPSVAIINDDEIVSDVRNAFQPTDGVKRFSYRLYRRLYLRDSAVVLEYVVSRGTVVFVIRTKMTFRCALAKVKPDKKKLTRPETRIDEKSTLRLSPEEFQPGADRPRGREK